MSYGDIKIKSNSKFLKIESGQPRDIRLIDETPYETMKHSTETGQIICTGENCTLCADGLVPAQKFITNVYDHGAKRVLLFEYGTGIAKQLKSLAVTLEEENKSILDVDIKIDATGSQKTKRYTVTPRMSSKPLPEGIIRHKIEGENALPF